MRIPAEEIHKLSPEGVYSIVLPKNVEKGNMCGCLIRNSVVVGAQLKQKVLMFRRAGQQVRVFSYHPDIQVEYSLDKAAGKQVQDVFISVPSSDLGEGMVDTKEVPVPPVVEEKLAPPPKKKRGRPRKVKDE